MILDDVLSEDKILFNELKKHYLNRLEKLFSWKPIPAVRSDYLYNWYGGAGKSVTAKSDNPRSLFQIYQMKKYFYYWRWCRVAFDLMGNQLFGMIGVLRLLSNLTMNIMEKYLQYQKNFIIS